MLKLVIDTNVLVDGSEDYFRYANRILDLVISGNVEAYANRGTLRENKLIAHRKILDEGYSKKLEYFFDAIKPVQPSERLDVVEDSEDNKILESAVAAEADYLITSDRHLLKLESYKGIKIVRPNEFWSRWEEEGDGGWKNWLNNFIR
jgi:uncharacterized protein